MTIWREDPERAGKRNHEREYRSTKIEDLNLSVRSFNSLKRGGCSTVGDILDLMDEEGNGLRRVRNLGMRSETEIKEKIEQLRLEYAAKYPGGRARLQNDTSSGHTGFDQGNAAGPRLILRPARILWEREIGEFHISHHSEDKLRSCGVSRIKDLYATHPKQEPGWYAVRELFRKIAEDEIARV